MTTLEAVAAEATKVDRPVPVVFHTDEELRELIDHAYANGLRALTCETPAADQTVRQVAARAQVIAARRVRDGMAKWVFFLPTREAA